MASRLAIARPFRALSLLTAAICTFVLVPATVGRAAPAPTGADARHAVSALQTKMEQATEDYDAARVALGRSQQREAQLRAQLVTQQRTVAAFEDQVSAFAAAAYRRGRIDLVASLLQSGSPQMFLDELSTLDNLSRDQRSQLDQLIAAKRVLDRRKQQIDTELVAQRKNEQTLKARKASIEKDLATWKALVARADAEAAQARARASRAARAARVTAVRAPAPVATVTRRAVAPGRAAGPAAKAPSGGGYTGVASGSAAVALRTAYAQLGKPYQWGAAGPGSFDCSGLMMYSWAAAGVSLPHSSRAQYGVGQHVSRSALRPGDLVFFGSPIYHVGMYVGGGMMIHAPTTGDVVRVAPMLSDFSGATRP